MRLIVWRIGGTPKKAADVPEIDSSMRICSGVVISAETPGIASSRSRTHDSISGIVCSRFSRSTS